MRGYIDGIKGALERHELLVNVQSGIPDKNALVFNIHIANQSLGVDRASCRPNEWDISFTYYEYGKLDYLISSKEPSFRDVPFPILENDVAQFLSSQSLSLDKVKQLERCRVHMELWVHEIIDRSFSFSADTKAWVYSFFGLPAGRTADDPPFEFPSVNSIRPVMRSGGSVAGSTVSSSSSPSKSATSGKEEGKSFNIFFRAIGLHVKSSLGGVDASTNQHMQSPEDGNRAHRVAAHLKDNVLDLLKVRVQRGGVESLRGYVEYEVQIFYSDIHRPYKTVDRYGAFRQLAADLAAADGSSTLASYVALSKFPPKSSTLSFGCTEEELSERARLLDRWLREVCCSYKFMGDNNRKLIRNFLCFDMSNDLEIYLQDKMMNGQIEASRAEIFVPPVYVNAAHTVTKLPSISESPIKIRNSQAIGEIPEGLVIKSPEKKKIWGYFSSESPSSGAKRSESTYIPSVDSRLTSIVYSVKNKKDCKDVLFSGSSALISVEDGFGESSKGSCLVN